LEPILLDSVKRLLSLGIGDKGRLEHIQDALEKNKTLYSSDKNYVENKIKQCLENPNYINELTKTNVPENKIEKSEQSKNKKRLDAMCGADISNELSEFIARDNRVRKNELEEVNARWIQENEIEKIKQNKELELLLRAKNTPDDLYDSKQIDKSDDSISIRIFYDLARKNNKYWKSTDTLDRIKFSSPEIQDELKIKQNKLTIRISTERGSANKFAQLISGGNYNFWDHDSSGYYFQAHLSIEEEFLKKIIIKHIRFCFPEMSIYESKLSITSFLSRTKVDYSIASDMLKKITRVICDEINQDMGSVLIEERLRR